MVFCTQSACTTRMIISRGNSNEDDDGEWSHERRHVRIVVVHTSCQNLQPARNVYYMRVFFHSVFTFFGVYLLYLHFFDIFEK